MSNPIAAQKSNDAAIRLPEEHFWECYSPHHEFPLSTVASVFLFGLFFGLMLMTWTMWSFGWHSEVYQPPRADVIALAGGGGTGGYGRPNTSSAGANSDNATEAAQDHKLEQRPKVNPNELNQLPTPKMPGQVEIAKIRENADSTKFAETEIEDFLAKAKTIAQEVRHNFQKAQATKKQAASQGNKGGTSPGTGGGYGGGKGSGRGQGDGPGTGTDPLGRHLTTTERRGLRWNIAFGESESELRSYFQALRITLALKMPGQFNYLVFDFSGSAPTRMFGDLRLHLNKLKWFPVDPLDETKPDPKMAARIARMFSLPRSPQDIILFLPKVMEEELARLESEYSRGAPEHLIEATYFEIRQRTDGSLGPVVVGQRLKR